MNTSSFFIVFLILVVNEVSKATVPKLQLTVFYESNCRDSRSFVLQQLRPAMQQLHEHVRVQFVPFGKATSTDYGFGGFKCQHGKQECFGNLVQECALMFLNSDMEKVNYVACEMESYAGSRGNYKCVEQAKILPEKVQDCIDSGQGAMQQYESQYLTSQVAPKFIPTVTVNNVFLQEIQDSSMKDLFGTLCSYLPHAKPCSHHFNRIALKEIMYGHPILMSGYW